MLRGARSPSGCLPFMKRLPFAFTSFAPSPRTVSEIRKRGVVFFARAEGWN